MFAHISFDSDKNETFINDYGNGEIETKIHSTRVLA